MQMTNPRSASGRNQGFTLIELMIVVLVLSILASIAYASYTNAVTSSRRASAAACLLETSQMMERTYTTNMSYAGVTTLPASACRTEQAAFYTISLNGTPTATGYSLQAVPQGVQAGRDAKCGTLGLNQAGNKTASGTAGAAACW